MSLFPWIDALGDNMFRFVVDLDRNLESGVSSAWDAVDGAGRSGVEFFIAAGKTLDGAFQDAFDGVGALGGYIEAGVAETASFLGDTVPAGFIGFGGLMKRGVMLFGEGVAYAGHAIQDGLVTAGEGAYRFTLTAGGAMIRWSTVAFADVAAWVDYAAGDVGDWMEDAFDDVVDFLRDAANTLLTQRLPELDPLSDAAAVVAKWLFPGYHHEVARQARNDHSTMVFVVSGGVAAVGGIKVSAGLYVDRHGWGFLTDVAPAVPLDVEAAASVTCYYLTLKDPSGRKVFAPAVTIPIPPLKITGKILLNLDGGFAGTMVEFKVTLQPAGATRPGEPSLWGKAASAVKPTLTANLTPAGKNIAVLALAEVRDNAPRPEVAANEVGALDALRGVGQGASSLHAAALAAREPWRTESLRTAGRVETLTPFAPRYFGYITTLDGTRAIALGANPGDQVTIYKHGGFAGASQALGIGRHGVSDLTIGNDALSSIAVPAGMRATLFQHGDFTGQSWTYHDPGKALVDANDATSSIIVERCSQARLVPFSSGNPGQAAPLRLIAGVADPQRFTLAHGASILGGQTAAFLGDRGELEQATVSLEPGLADPSGVSLRRADGTYLVHNGDDLDWTRPGDRTDHAQHATWRMGQPAVVRAVHGAYLAHGQYMLPGDTRVSADGWTWLTLGRGVLKLQRSLHPIHASRVPEERWSRGASRTDDRCFLLMDDGRLTLYAGTPAERGEVLWQSEAYGAPGECFAAVTDAGLLAVFRGRPAEPGALIWTSAAGKIHWFDAVEHDVVLIGTDDPIHFNDAGDAVRVYPYSVPQVEATLDLLRLWNGRFVLRDDRGRFVEYSFSEGDCRATRTALDRLNGDGDDGRWSIECAIDRGSVTFIDGERQINHGTLNRVQQRRPVALVAANGSHVGLGGGRTLVATAAEVGPLEGFVLIETTDGVYLCTNDGALVREIPDASDGRYPPGAAVADSLGRNRNTKLWIDGRDGKVAIRTMGSALALVDDAIRFLAVDAYETPDDAKYWFRIEEAKSRLALNLVSDAGKYVRLVADEQRLRADSSGAGTAERLVLLELPDGAFALKAPSGRFVRNDGGHVRVDAESITSQCRLAREYVRPHHHGLRFEGGGYLSARHDQGELLGTAPQLRAWEVFRCEGVARVERGLLRAPDGRYVSVSDHLDDRRGVLRSEHATPVVLEHTLDGRCFARVSEGRYLGIQDSDGVRADGPRSDARSLRVEVVGDRVRLLAPAGHAIGLVGGDPRLLGERAGPSLELTLTDRFEVGIRAEPRGTSLPDGRPLFLGESLRSNNARYQVYLWSNGDLVVSEHGGAYRWSSGRSLARPVQAFLTVDRDGNVAIYHGAYPSRGAILWASGGAGNRVGDHHLDMQNDGNLVLYNGQSGRAEWSSKHGREPLHLRCPHIGAYLQCDGERASGTTHQGASTAWRLEWAGGEAFFLVDRDRRRLLSTGSGELLRSPAGTTHPWQRWRQRAAGNKWLVQSVSHGRNLRSQPNRAISTSPNCAAEEQWEFEYPLS